MARINYPKEKKKYRTEKDPETGLLRVIALKNFSDVKKGQRGGLIEKEHNLSQEGDCWVSNDARVYGNARVFEDAEVGGNAVVYDNAKIHGNAWVTENACVSGNAEVFEWAWIKDNACISENAKIFGRVQVEGKVSGNATIYGDIYILDSAEVCGEVKLWSIKRSVINNTTIKNRKDSIMLPYKKSFSIFALDHPCYARLHYSATIENYLKNIKTIRQLYGEEV